MDEQDLRNEIYDKVKQLYALQQSIKPPYIPGKTYINYSGRVYDEQELVGLVDASLDFWLTAGKCADAFETKLAQFIGAKYCMFTNSGSSANLLAVSALTSPKLKDRQLKTGDEVITTPCGFPTTINPIIQNGLIPLFVDIKLGTYNIDTDLLCDAITDKTKAIMVAHTLGNPADLQSIMEIAEESELWVIEDNCDALGSTYMGKYTGSIADMSTCSFFPAHHITTGEGGAVLTSDPLLRKIIMSFRDWGRDCWCDPGTDNTCKNRFNRQFGDMPKGYDHKYIYSHIGYNLKATEMQAAIGIAQIDKLPEFIQKRKANFKLLYEGLRQYQKHIVLPETTQHSDPAWFGFPICVIPSAPFTKNVIVNYLEEHHIATRPLFGGNLTKQPAYEHTKWGMYGTYDNTDIVMNHLFWIGVYPGLTKEMIDYVLQTFNNFFVGIK
jgi:CDP-6-deoxy-D-xylo-4-hexulose-3-dehydrase